MKGILVIRKYKNRRLYDTERSTHLTREELLELVRSGRTVQVQEASSGDDVTVETLLQLLLAEDGLAAQIFTPEFLHFLIRSDASFLGRFFRDTLPFVIRSMQQGAGAFPQSPWSSGFGGMSGFPDMSGYGGFPTAFHPFGRSGPAPEAEPDAPGRSRSEDVDALREELAAMREELSRLREEGAAGEETGEEASPRKGRGRRGRPRKAKKKK